MLRDDSSGDGGQKDIIYSDFEKALKSHIKRGQYQNYIHMV